jgi:hypothetical protein
LTDAAAADGAAVGAEVLFDAAAAKLTGLKGAVFAVAPDLLAAFAGTAAATEAGVAREAARGGAAAVCQPPLSSQDDAALLLWLLAFAGPSATRLEGVDAVTSSATEVPPTAISLISLSASSLSPIASSMLLSMFLTDSCKADMIEKNPLILVAPNDVLLLVLGGESSP